MKFKNPFKSLTLFEWILWGLSVVMIVVSSLLSGKSSALETIASLVGVTALIFVAKGLIIGQAMTVVFSFLYGIVSLQFHYWGEMITYLFMSMPIALLSTIEWIRHPYKNTDVVEVSRVSKKQIFTMCVLGAVTTVVFYFILKVFDTPNLFFSTVSITTSFMAAYLTFLRSPYYGIGYGLNDIVLIILWSLASVEDISYLPMVMCFVMFLLNDIYGFYNWRRLSKQQKVNNV
ncbi:MAG: nicotinamide mononucleotide transporter [Ruminococcus sp.]|nr:nicotinamide mononucleotide transporter [Ruminococcus sp.]